jgi:hypothetical protein
MFARSKLYRQAESLQAANVFTTLPNRAFGLRGITPLLGSSRGMGDAGMQEDEWYSRVGLILGLISAVGSFFGSWIYCAVTYGFLFGFGLGWLPSAILAGIVFLVMRYLWPIPLLAILWLIVVILRH